MAYLVVGERSWHLDYLAFLRAVIVSWGKIIDKRQMERD